MQLFYSPNISENDSDFSFDKDESKHIAKVLRKKIDDTLHITNGKGWLFTAQITLVEQKKCTVSVTTKSFWPKRNYHLHLAVAPTKMNDRYEWFLEKATEIGIETITPIICEHSERKVIKTERYEKILQSAMKQSLQYYLPKLNEPMAFNDFIKQEFKSQTYIAHCEETDKISLKSQLKTATDCTILIGPEGDFSVKEIEIALQHHFIPVTLGDTRLRTETAAIVACHAFAFTNE